MINIEAMLQAFDEKNIPIYSLGDVEDKGILSLGRGQVISKKEMQSCPGNYPVYSSSAIGDGQIGSYGKYMFDDERITWSIDGGGKLFYRNNMRYSVTNVGGWIKVNDENILNTKYLYYCLISQWEKMTFDYTKKAHPSVIRGQYDVPIPKLSVQETIVSILDKFTSITDNLEEELDLRLKQFEFYGDVLMAENSTEYCLEEVCSIIDCPHTSPKWQQEGIPVIRNYNLVNGVIDTTNLSYVDEADYKVRTKRVVPQKDDILFSREAPIGNVGIIPEGFRCCQGQRVVLLRPNWDKVIPKYLLYVLQSKSVREQTAKAEAVGSTVSNFNISDLRKLKVYLPEINKQKDIISKLDVISSLCSNIEFGLPAEIASRKKQYKYYRDWIFSNCTEVTK